MKIAIWGSHQLTLTLLKHLYESPDFSIALVVTQADKRRSQRGNKIIATPSKKFAKEHDIPVITPTSLNNQKIQKEIIELTQNLDIVCHIILAYGKIIPKNIYEFPKYQSINFHASLLPELRGASPIESAILQQKKQTGWTLQKICENCDHGDIIFQTHWDIEPNDIKDTLYQKFDLKLSQVACSWVTLYLTQEYSLTSQISKNATYCSKFFTNSRQISWNNSAEFIRHQYRSFADNPGIFTLFENSPTYIKVDLNYSFQNYIHVDNLETGSIYYGDDKSIFWVVCKDKSIPISQIKFSNHKFISAIDFYNGYYKKKPTQLKFDTNI